MDARLEEIEARLASARADLLAALNVIPQADWQRRAAEGRWSVAEVLDHLALVERRIFQLLAADDVNAADPDVRPAEDAAPPGGNAAPHTVDTAIMMDRRTRIDSPDTFRPRLSPDPAETLEQLERVRLDTVAFVSIADAERLAALRHPHFAIGVLTGLQWLDFIGGHERRHTAQIAESVAQLHAPKP